jgi:MFS family permease
MAACLVDSRVGTAWKLLTMEEALIISPANKTFLSFFGGKSEGVWTALTSAMYQIGAVVALPFAGPVIDGLGRRLGMVTGALLIIVGTIINGLTSANGSNSQLKGGRFVLGFGVTIISAAGPIYVVETAHPAFRSVITAYCQCYRHDEFASR